MGEDKTRHWQYDWWRLAAWAGVSDEWNLSGGLVSHLGKWTREAGWFLHVGPLYVGGSVDLRATGSGAS